MQPAGHGPVPDFPPFDAVALADWLGVPVAMLSQPPGRLHFAANQSHSIGHAPQLPVAVTVQHRMDSDNPLDPGPSVMIYVRTRLRQAQGEPDAVTTRDNLAQAIHDYQQDSAGRAGVPLRPDARPAELDEYLRRDLQGWDTRPVLVDGTPMPYEYVTLSDYATGEEITGVGGPSDGRLIAVVGPARLLNRIELRLVHPR